MSVHGTSTRRSVLKFGFVALFIGVAAAQGLGASAARAGTPHLTWVARSPASSPSARFSVDMAADTLTGQVVLFGGVDSGGLTSETWTWNGSTWTQQFPATSPTATLFGDVMATDPTTGTPILFDGDTWSWSGSDWVELSPADSPPDYLYASMATDTANGQIVLFGGSCESDTWTWNGSNWTEQSPGSVPPGREAAAMASDPTTGNVVMFGGNNCGTDGYINDTWTWDGSDWMPKSSSASPSARGFAGFAPDPVLGQAVLFGGYDGSNMLGDTWTWSGSNWLQLKPTTSPSDRDSMGMSTDPNGRILLFGGTGSSTLGDSWSLGPSLAVTPTFGGQATSIQATVVGAKAGHEVKVKYTSGHKHVLLCSGHAAADTSFSCATTIPTGSAAGPPGVHEIDGDGGGVRLDTPFLLQGS
jgi:hypothetical protein